jgi:plastocyanin
MKKLVLSLSMLGLLALPLAACGSSSSSSTTTSSAASTTTAAGGGGGGGATVNVAAAADGSLAFDQKSLSAPAGSDTFDFNNPSPVTHDFCIEDSSGSEVGCSDSVSNGKTQLTEDLQPGTYTFFCSIDGHRQAGMEGTLTVK